MRKALVILIIIVLLIGVSGCESLRTIAQNSEAPPTQDEEASPTKDALSRVDVANASNIATAINAYNALNPCSGPLPDDITLEDAKEIIGEGLWPAKLSDEDARAAWRLIIYKDGVADLTPEAQEIWDSEEPEQTPEAAGDAQTSAYANAGMIATAVNAYNALYPDRVLPDDITLEGAKETVGVMLWPVGLSDEEEKEAWKLIIYKDGVADLVPEA